MFKAKKIILVAVLLGLIYGLSCPWQRVTEPLFLGFLPAPMFYLLLVHIGFVGFMGYITYAQAESQKTKQGRNSPNMHDEEVKP
jgi:mannose/fructose/N-acetylgalactosamine-specific phosphotransferase system component IIC